MGYATNDHSAQGHIAKIRIREETFRTDPIPGTGVMHWRSAYHNRRAGKPSGVSARETYLPHRYMDEGDKGPGHRRAIRRLSNKAWRSEVESHCPTYVKLRGSIA